jgi:pimeloyl-ACP methyl ester carboxylesterase
MPTAPFRPEPFASSTDPAELDDLRRRLRATRWPRTPADAGWAEGTDLAALRTLVEYWANDFDWAAAEARLNELPRFRATLDVRAGNGADAGRGADAASGEGTEPGTIGIHYVHVRAASGAHPLPLILTHGWPDSFWRYSKVIELLTDPAAHGGDPEDAFDVIVPDMPGFGYSDQPVEALNSIGVAALWTQLMTGLGYERFAAAGGDIGSHVSRYLALDAPSRVVAVHRMDAGLPSPAIDPADLSAPEREWLAGAAAWGASEGAYAAMHRTKPLTAAVGLTDSPAGLAAWILEKLHAWTDTDLAPDDVLTNLSIYWFTGTIGSSMRMYRANAAIPPAQLARRVEVPSGFSLFDHDIVRAPREWLDRSANTVSVTHPPHGGHFAPLEQPARYADELRTFFRPYR